MPRLLVSILALALILRLGVVAGTWDAQPWGDPADYHVHGSALAQAGTYPATTFAEPGGASAFRPAVFPYLLGATYELVGIRVNAGRLIGVLLGTLTVGLVFLIARRVWDPRHALWAAGLTAVFPPLVWLSAALLSEIVFVPLVLGLVMLATFAVALIPWTARNLHALDALRPFGTQSGYTLASQWNSEAAQHNSLRAVTRNPPQMAEFADLIGRPGKSEADVEAQLRERAVRFAADRPDHVLAAVWLNTQRLLEAGPGHTFVSETAHREMGIPGGWRASLQLSVYAVVLAALVGGVLLVRRRQRGPVWLWLVPVVLFASVFPMTGSPRYRTAIDPFLLMLAAGAVVHLIARRQIVRRR